MPVSIEVEQHKCSRCGHTEPCGYLIRGGDNHEKYGDPYTGSGFIATSGEVKALSGCRCGKNDAFDRKDYAALKRMMSPLKLWWRRIKDGKTKEVR